MRRSVLKSALIIFSIAAMLMLQSCVSLKPYERIYIDDPDMQLGLDAGLSFQHYIFSIREGAIPAGTSKASGGCGCN